MAPRLASHFQVGVMASVLLNSASRAHSPGLEAILFLWLPVVPSCPEYSPEKETRVPGLPWSLLLHGFPLRR